MNELNIDPNAPKKTLLTRPGAQSPDVAALSGLLDVLNNPLITGAEVPRGTDPKAALKSHPDPVGAPGTNGVDGAPRDIEIPAYSPAQTPVPVPVPQPVEAPHKFFFTGRLKAGKDHAATAAGLKIHGFADPLYAIASYFFGRTINSSEGKDLPGCRAFLQAVGQYGRGTVNEQYPLTPARAVFVEQARKLGVSGAFGEHGVDWTAYGRNENLWLDACLLRIDLELASLPETRVAITNCRFENELNALKAAGFQHWHVMTSAKTWSERLLKSKLTPESPAVKDMSERLAAGFDSNVIKQISTQKTGPMLRVIWNDRGSPPPSPRLHTLDTFLKLVKAEPVQEIVSTDDF